MSQYIEWLNRIKESASSEWLTHNQVEIYTQVIKQFSDSPFINITGPRGSGKTFIARILAKENGFHYTQDLSQIATEYKKVIVDHITYTRMIRALKISKEIEQLILVTSKAVDDPMPVLKLSIDQEDLFKFKRNIYRCLSLEFLSENPISDFETILINEAKIRGEKQWDSKN